MRVATLLLCLSAGVWAQEESREIWLEEPVTRDGACIHGLRLSSYDDVLAVEVDVVIAGQARLARLKYPATVFGFYAADNVVGDTLKITLARAVATVGFGRLAEVSLPDSLPEPRMGLTRVSLNGGAIPVEFRPIGPDTTPGRPGDFDGDGVVGLDDFFLFADHFGAVLGDPTFDPRYDLNGDGAVGFHDFFLFADLFGT